MRIAPINEMNSSSGINFRGLWGKEKVTANYDETMGYEKTERFYYPFLDESADEIKKVQEYNHKTPGWFLDSKDDNIDSSDFLEVALCEFFVQGLEIDLACVMWDADFRYDPVKKKWRFYKFNKKAWSEKTKKTVSGRTPEAIEKKRKDNIKTLITQAYMRNAYRVLLTRARLGLVICVPYGSNDDETRLPKFYDDTYNYLCSLGFKDLDHN